MKNRLCQSNQWKTSRDLPSRQLRRVEYLFHFKKGPVSGTIRKASLDTDARR